MNLAWSRPSTRLVTMCSINLVIRSLTELGGFVVFWPISTKTPVVLIYQYFNVFRTLPAVCVINITTLA